MNGGPLRLSIVTTLYNSEKTIADFVARSSVAANKLVGDSFEIVIVNDGSPDQSYTRVTELLPTFPTMILVDLSRNFGHHTALFEGLRRSSGDLVFLIDSDLEEEPELLTSFMDTLQDTEADSVFGYQEARKGGHFERLSGRIYWRIFRSLSGLNIPANSVTCRLMTRRYVDALGLFGEREISMGGLFALTGFRQTAIPIQKGHKGTTSYSFALRVWHLVNSISAFSTKPLNIIFLIGVAVSTIGLCFVSYLLFLATFGNEAPVGWTSLMASIWLLGGLLLSSLGIVAIYLGKIFTEVKQRPRSIVRSIVRHGDARSSEP